jgi:putative SOS response-associated peptidase YedK
MRWGLVPSWAKDAKLAPINAKAETLASKPMFRSLLKSRRCVIPTDGFYEWQKVPGQKGKVPYRIELKDRSLFGFAGLWDTWKGPDGKEVPTFAIVTTKPNEVVAPIHDRMPVILTPEAEVVWLDPAVTEAKALAECLKPYPESEVKAYVVSTLVNAPANDMEACAAPAEK